MNVLCDCLIELNKKASMLLYRVPLSCIVDYKVKMHL